MVVVKTGEKPQARDPYQEPAPKPKSMVETLAALQEADEQAAIKKTKDLEGTPDMRSLIELADEMRAEKETIDQLEAEVKVHKDRYNELRNVLIPDKMKTLGVVNAAGKGGFTFRGGKIHLETTVSASCSKDNEAVFFAWAKENGAADIIKQTVNAQTLSAMIRERRADGLEDPPGVAVFEQVKAKLTVGK